ncbi:MAG: septum formation inhibitor Maf [Gammaproteobacteria bacterium]|nr:septum formation inhibitor Maf [Gammaproteobacteria bacterium]
MPPAAPLVCLASVSPRRHELLAQIGVAHVVSAADIDEAVHPGEPAAQYVVRVACAKARVVRARGMALPVLAADTTVVIDGTILAKPRDRADGLAMLARLSGRTHEVLTAVALATSAGLEYRLSASAVRMRQVSAAEGAAYWESGEPRDKAGGYAIQGRGALFIEHLSGSYSGVMGLPLYETGELLAAAGLDW